LHNRIDEFSTDRLISLYEKLNPNLELKVSWSRTTGLFC
jgi:hypothetical protein